MCPPLPPPLFRLGVVVVGRSRRRPTRGAALPPAAPAAVGRLYFAFLRLFSAASVRSHGAPRSGRAPTLVHGAEPKSGPSQMLYVQRVPAVR